MNTQQLIALKQRLKKKKPSFTRQGYGSLPRIPRSWRKPKGIHSKLRHGFAGHHTRVEPGYGTPVILRGTNKQGIMPVLIHTLKQLETINPNNQGIIIAHVGMKTKKDIITAATNKKITILTLKNPAQFLSQIESKLKQRKELQQKRKQNKQEKTKKIEKETSKKTPAPEKTAELSDEAQKEKTKKELDKVLTKKE